MTEKLSRELNKMNVVRYQHDNGNALPHVEKYFKQWLEQQFAQRDWLITNQPQCSLACNVNGTYLFFGVSKKVSIRQGLDFSGKMLKEEEVFKLANAEFEKLQSGEAVEYICSEQAGDLCDIRRQMGN